jgi:hypothetical protein
MQPTSWKRPFKATISVDFKPTFRPVMFEFTDCGRSCPLHEQLLLTQHSFARADNVLLAVQWNSPEWSFKRLKPSKALNRSAIMPRYEDPLICQRICTRQTRSFYFPSSSISLRFELSGFAPLIRRYLASRFPRPSSKSAVFAPYQHLEAYLWK